MLTPRSFDGLVEGYNSVATNDTKLTSLQLAILNAIGDFLDLIPVRGPALVTLRANRQTPVHSHTHAPQLRLAVGAPHAPVVSPIRTLASRPPVPPPPPAAPYRKCGPLPSSAPPPSWFECLACAPDQALSPTLMPDVATMTPKDLKHYIASRGHCSALVKVTGNFRCAAGCTPTHNARSTHPIPCGANDAFVYVMVLLSLPVICSWATPRGSRTAPCCGCSRRTS